MKYSLRTTSHISGVRSLITKKKKKEQQQAKLYKEFRRLAQKWEQKGKKGSEPQPGCLAL